MAQAERLGNRALMAGAVGVGAALGGLMFWSRRRARGAERANPPMGTFVEADGVRLHYVSRGRGRPVVFLHGLGGMVQDWHLSLLDRAARNWRCIAFDRPGYGWSERPRWTQWTPEKQAETLRRATKRLGLERPLVVGHSYGALVAAAWALDAPEDVAGVVLLSGYFYPKRRLDVALLAAPRIPGVGSLARATLWPLLGRALLPRTIQRLFAPNPVPALFNLFPTELLLRPGQMRAQTDEAAHLNEAARRLSERYGDISVPTIILAGEADRVTDPAAHSIRLHRQVAHSALRVAPATGHMIHHVRPADVIAAIELAWHEADIATRTGYGFGGVPTVEAT
jgi:pimeloyl-ACP methyl ester carboxylesterase